MGVQCVSYDEKVNLLQDLFMEYSKCRNNECGLYRKSPLKVFGRGNVDSPIMLISESPKEEEYEERTQYAGRAGKLLQDYLRSIGVSSDDVYITDVTLCRSLSSDRSIAEGGKGKSKYNQPTNKQLQCCLERLMQEIYIVDPTILLLLGEVPTSLLAKKVAAQVNGRFLSVPIKGKDQLVYYPAMSIHSKYRLLKSTSPLIGDERAITLLHLKKAKSIALEFCKYLPDIGETNGITK